ncbi:hypothetical protein BVRB_6g151800 [Beta vulgaris subsp. vulgaris]|nr:hypothetical protein BVRB_6g151800 [Beta vulgaris subsp. vulgaris]
MLKVSDGTNCSAYANSATYQHVDSNNATTSFPVDHVNLDKLQNDKADVRDQIAGYIFMCNTGTKPDCFIYRVFGLPASRMRVVEKIKPDTKLFLFDFDVKLLYGLYVADCSGKLALEPYAFGGRFPAQVKFSIVRDCLPLPEVAFRDAIKENYYGGSKFKQELNEMQVNKLVSLLRDIRPISVQPPPRASPAFLDAVRGVYEKYVVPSQQIIRQTYMHHERSVPEVPQVVNANSYYGQNPMPFSSVSLVSPAAAPSSSMLSSSLGASHWVAMAAEALNTESQTSNITLPLNEPGVSCDMPYNGSDVSGARYYDGYQDQTHPSSHQALPVNTDQGAYNRPIHAYEMQPSSVSSYYTQIQGHSTLPQTPTAGSSGIRVENTHMYHNSTYHPASISSGYTHTQGHLALPQTQPSVSSRVDADNPYLNYSGVNPATLAYDHGNQGYYSCHQNAAPTTVQQVNNAPADASQMHPAYWPTAPHPGYMT